MGIEPIAAKVLRNCRSIGTRCRVGNPVRGGEIEREVKDESW